MRKGFCGRGNINVNLDLLMRETKNIPNDLCKILKLPFSGLIFQLYALTEIIQRCAQRKLVATLSALVWLCNMMEENGNSVDQERC